MLYQHVESFINHLRVEKSASSLTLVSYKTDLHQFFSFLSAAYDVKYENISAELLNHRTVREYLTEMQNSGIDRKSVV